MEPDFEIIEEGFDDDSGEKVTIGTSSPANTLMTFVSSDKSIHIVSSTLSKNGNPTEVLMDLLQNGLDKDYLESNDISIVVE